MATRTLFPDDVRPDFAGFSPAAFKVLRGLKRNNDRAWFQKNKEVYDSEVKFAMECLVAEFGRDRRTGLPVFGDPKSSIFRVYRDTRFSRDKTPYKTHCGAVLSRTARKGDPGLVYIHLAPGESFVSSGFYRPDPDLLLAWRRRMTANPKEFLTLVKAYARKGKYYMRSISELKTMPRGFAEHATGPVADYLRWESFLITRDVADKDMQSRALVKIVREMAGTARPLLNYGWNLWDQVVGTREDARQTSRGLKELHEEAF